MCGFNKVAATCQTKPKFLVWFPWNTTLAFLCKYWYTLYILDSGVKILDNGLQKPLKHVAMCAFCWELSLMQHPLYKIYSICLLKLYSKKVYCKHKTHVNVFVCPFQMLLQLPHQRFNTLQLGHRSRFKRLHVRTLQTIKAVKIYLTNLFHKSFS